MKTLFCDHCDDAIKLYQSIFAYGHKFCSPKCCASWEQDHSRQKKFETFERINSVPYRLER